MAFDLKAALTNGETPSERAYLEAEGTHYLRLVGYDFFDGERGEGKRGHSGKAGPLFNWEVVESPVWPPSDPRSCMIVMNGTSTRSAEATAKWRKSAANEVVNVCKALFVSADLLKAGQEISIEDLAADLEDVDKFGSAFRGTVVRCDVVQKPGTTIFNRKWSFDDKAYEPF